MSRTWRRSIPSSFSLHSSRPPIRVILSPVSPQLCSVCRWYDDKIVLGYSRRTVLADGPESGALWRLWRCRRDMVTREIPHSSAEFPAGPSAAWRFHCGARTGRSTVASVRPPLLRLKGSVLAAAANRDLNRREAQCPLHRWWARTITDAFGGLCLGPDSLAWILMRGPAPAIASNQPRHVPGTQSQ